MTKKMKAFPQRVSTEYQYQVEHGMDLRDYFAGQIAPALIINPIVNQSIFDVAKFNKEPNEAALSRMAYVIADAMMKVREL